MPQFVVHLQPASVPLRQTFPVNYHARHGRATSGEENSPSFKTEGGTPKCAAIWGGKNRVVSKSHVPKITMASEQATPRARGMFTIGSTHHHRATTRRAREEP